jgi:GPH family glycoside/pentoside/hexuronide:cation symporter
MDVIPFSIIADVCDLDELTSHRRREGAFMGVYNGIYKAGITLSPVITNLCLELCGFDHLLVRDGVAQTDGTVQALRVALIAVPAVLFAASAACAVALPLRRKDVEAAQAELQRRANQETAVD